MKLTNSPVPVPMSVYEKQIANCVGVYSKLPGVIAVCTMGSIAAPGYSDIDFVVFVDNKFEKQNAQILSHRQPGINQNLLIHAPVIIGPQSRSNMWQLLYMSNLDTLHGQIPNDFVCSPPNEELDRFFSLATLIDFNEARLQQYASAEGSGVLNHRHWSTILWSLTHSVGLLEKVSIQLSGKSMDLIEEIRDDRKRWVSSNTLAADGWFIDAFIRSKEVTKEIVLKAMKKEAQLLKLELDVDTIKKSAVFRQGNKTLRCLGEDAIAMTSFSVSFKGRNLPVSTEIIVPRSHSEHLLHYGFKPLRGTATLTTSGPYADFLSQRGQSARVFWQELALKKLAFSNGAYLGLPVLENGSLKYRGAAVIHRVLDALRNVKHGFVGDNA